MPDSDTTESLHCVWAESGLALHNSGRALLCCHSRKYLEDDQNKQIYWNTHDLESAWKSPTRQEIQQALRRGERHWNCQACWDEELSGRQSRRTINNKLFSYLTTNDKSPLLMDLKLGNTCNLACRTCWPEVSSKWYKDYWEVHEKLQQPDYQKYLSKWKTIQLSYNDDNHNLWTQLKDYLGHVKHIDIYGAEPFLSKQLFMALSWSHEQGISADQSLHINTNGTIWNDSYMESLASFKKINLDISLDGIEQKHDYIRYGESWSRVNDNLRKFVAFRDNNPNVEICACITVSNLNIFYLDEIWQYVIEKGLQPFFNLVHMPEHACIRCIPDEGKKRIKQKYLYCDGDRGWFDQISGVISFMDIPDSQQSQHWKEFLRTTKELDRLRSQDFDQTFPEYSQLLSTLAT